MTALMALSPTTSMESVSITPSTALSLAGMVGPTVLTSAGPILTITVAPIFVLRHPGTPMVTTPLRLVLPAVLMIVGLIRKQERGSVWRGVLVSTMVTVSIPLFTTLTETTIPRDVREPAKSQILMRIGRPISVQLAALVTITQPFPPTTISSLVAVSLLPSVHRAQINTLGRTTPVGASRAAYSMATIPVLLTISPEPVFPSAISM